jgi:hypothetical protein
LSQRDNHEGDHHLPLNGDAILLPTRVEAIEREQEEAKKRDEEYKQRDLAYKAQQICLEQRLVDLEGENVTLARKLGQWTLALVIVGGAGIFVAVWQSVIAKQAAQAAQAAAVTAATALKETKTQFAKAFGEMQAQTAQSKRTADASIGALAQARAHFLADQQPYVWRVDVGPERSTPGMTISPEGRRPDGRIMWRVA